MPSLLYAQTPSTVPDRRPDHTVHPGLSGENSVAIEALRAQQNSVDTYIPGTYDQTPAETGDDTYDLTPVETGDQDSLDTYDKTPSETAPRAVPSEVARFDPNAVHKVGSQAAANQRAGEGFYVKRSGSWQRRAVIGKAPALKEGAQSVALGHRAKGPRIGTYDNEEEVATHMTGGNGNQRTHYFRGAEARAHETRVDGGLLLDQQGKGLDSKGSFEAYNGEERRIFAIDEQGTLRTADAWNESRALSATSSKHELVHHSSLVEGKRVIGAGTMKIDDGRVKKIANTSGHYQPGDEQLFQSLQYLDDRGADLSSAEVERATGKHVERSGMAEEVLASGGNFQTLQDKQGMLRELTLGTIEKRRQLDQEAEARSRRAP